MANLSRDYAVLLLSKTKLTYKQISELTELSMSKINELAQEVRPKEIRDGNTMLDTAPDVQEELLKLKDEMEQFQIQAHAHSKESSSFTKDVRLHYSILSGDTPLQKDLLLSELEDIKTTIENTEVKQVQFNINIQGT